MIFHKKAKPISGVRYGIQPRWDESSRVYYFNSTDVTDDSDSSRAVVKPKLKGNFTMVCFTGEVIEQIYRGKSWGGKYKPMLSSIRPEQIFAKCQYEGNKLVKTTLNTKSELFKNEDLNDTLSKLAEGFKKNLKALMEAERLEQSTRSMNLEKSSSSEDLLGWAESSKEIAGGKKVTKHVATYDKKVAKAINEFVGNIVGQKVKVSVEDIKEVHNQLEKNARQAEKAERLGY